jgi:branched-subunit amino acid transport protein
VSTGLLLGSVGVLAVGTYAIRAAGPLLRARVSLPPAVERLAGLATVVLLGALVVTTTLLDGHDLAGVARPAGVVVGGVLAWRRAPFVVVVVAAAAVTALLRAVGVG